MSCSSLAATKPLAALDSVEAELVSEEVERIAAGEVAAGSNSEEVAVEVVEEEQIDSTAAAEVVGCWAWVVVVLKLRACAAECLD